MAKKQKLTQNQQAYKKEVARIKRSIKNIEKRGYFFQQLPDLNTPKRVSKKALEKLQNTKAKDLYKYTVKVNEDTGEFIKGTTARKEEYKARAEKAKRTRELNERPHYTSLNDKEFFDVEYFPPYHEIILHNFKSTIKKFPQEIQNVFDQWFDEVSDLYTDQEIADMLEIGKMRGLIQYSDFAYSVSHAVKTVTSLTALLPNLSDNDKIRIFESMETLEDWDDIL